MFIYRIAVVQQFKREAVDRKKKGKTVFDRDTDTFKDRFSPENSPIFRELKSSGEVVIDLDRPTETPTP